jgi:hypothetical protein
VGIALAGGLAAGLFVAPLAGLLIAAVMLLELREARLRAVVLSGAIGCLLAMATYVVVSQHSNKFVSDISWPAHFGVANSLVWIALFLFAADARHRSSSGAHAHAHAHVPAHAARAGEKDGPAQSDVPEAE